jgi:hypothetical protein
MKCASAGFYIDLLLNSGDGGDMFVQNVGLYTTAALQSEDCAIHSNILPEL